MRNVSDKILEKIKTHILWSITFPEIRAVYGLMWKKRYSHTGHSNITRHLRISCHINKASNTHSVYVILITFPRQKLSRHRASLLHCAYISCLVHNKYHMNRPGIELGTSRLKSGTLSPKSIYSPELFMAEKFIGIVSSNCPLTTSRTIGNRGSMRIFFSPKRRDSF
jgi:hypothetical protein